MWNLPPPPGFQGLHPDKALHVYERHLPHWRQEGATYFVTAHLGDSLPEAQLRELKALREAWLRDHPEPASSELNEKLSREIMERIERWLDEGFGDCHFRQPQFAEFLVEAMHHFDLPAMPNRRTAFPGRLSSEGLVTNEEGGLEGRPIAEEPAWEGRPTRLGTPRYELGCYVVMPNHLHAIIRPLDPEVHPLEEIVGSWKQFSSRRINRCLRTHGELWYEESFDRIIRDEEHLWRVMQYIGRNPVKANLPVGAYSLWIRPEWEALGWRFECPSP